MKISDMYPSKYLRGDDLSGPVTVVIAGIETAEFYRPGEGKVRAFVLKCEKASKGVILSRPLAEGIAQALGSDETNDWTGKQVVLYAQPMRVAGQERIAIRARAVNGGAA
jgi:hypothetical protein